MSRSEYQHYADECLRWAAEAKNENHRQIYLEMAKAWTLAAKLAVQTRDASSSETTPSSVARFTLKDF
jgi:hypothetical protein